VQFEKNIVCDGTEGFIILYTTPELELKEWRCVPNGWVFAAMNDVTKDLLGEFRSIFKCWSLYNSLATDQDREDFLDRLTFYNSSNVRETSTPYAEPGTGWWRLSDITGWSIPNLADVFISNLTSTTYASSASVVNSHIPLNGQLFLTDSFNRIVSVMPALSHLDDTSDVSTSLYLDLSDIDGVDLMGLKGNPKEDPRQDGPGKVNFIVESVDNDDSIIVYIKEEFSGKAWFTESSKSKQTKSFSLLTAIGPKPMKLDKDLENYIKDLIVTSSDVTYWTTIRDTSFDYTIQYYNKYNTDQALFILSTYTFLSCFPGLSPYLHMSSVPQESLQLTVRENDEALSMFMGVVGAGGAYLSLEDLDFTFNPITDMEDSTSMGLGSAVALDFEEKKHKAVKYTHTEYKYEVICSATPGGAGTNSIPYLLKQKYISTKTYQAGPFLLNMDSKFWVTPGAENDLTARDPQGVPVWIGPFDDPKRYAFSLSTMSALFDLFDRYSGDDAFYNSLCIFSKCGHYLNESDIVLAAICNDMSKDAPQAYKARYDEYIKTVHNWFDGMFLRLNGLQYSFAGSHTGLTDTLKSLADKQGESKMAEIYERLLPGTTIANLNDAGGNAYCKDMLHWIETHGLARIALNTGAAGSNDTLVPAYKARLESTVWTWVSGGAQHTRSIDHMTGNITTVETPVNGHPEYLYISPRYTQLSTIDGHTSNGSNIMLGTKVMEWDRLFDLKNLFTNRLLGQVILSVAKTVDYTDNPEAVSSGIGNALSDIAVRSLKLSVSGEGTISFGYNYLAYK
jgi:hypothetical protein